MKTLTKIFLLLVCFSTFSQEASKLSLNVGAAYHASNENFNNTIGVGIYVSPIYQPNETWRYGLRAQIHALAYGIAVYPTATEEFREGANLLFITHAMFDRILKQDNRTTTYIGIQFSVLTHNRHIITARGPGPWVSIRRNVTDFGLGPRAGVQIGRVDLNAMYNFVGNSFVDYLTLSIGYKLKK